MSGLFNKAYKLLDKKTVMVGFFLIVLLPIYFLLLRPGYFWMQDDLQAFRVLEMYKCFQDFQIPCRWVPDPGYQYGYPQFIFYPPSIYYIGAVLHVFGIQVIDTVKILFISGVLLSAIFMYLFIKSWLGKWPAIVSAIVYSYVPYKALEVYVRGALSEFWALVFFPLIFWAVYSLCQKPTWRKVGLLSVSITLLLLTHNLMSLLFMPFLLVWSLYWMVIARSKKLVVMVGIGGLLGVGAALWFSLPVVMEKQYAHLETMVGGYFDYRAHFVDIKRLFFSNHWGYGSSGLNQDNDLSLSVGIVQWMSALIALVVSIVFAKRNKKLFIMVLILSGMSLMSAFMIHQKSSFIWSMIPSLEFAQFPWRFLGVNIFINSILAGLGVFIIMQWRKNWSYWYGLGLMVVTILLTISFFAPKEWYPISDQDKFSGKLWEKQLTISIFDYLPIYAQFPPIQKAPAYPEVLEGSVSFENYNKGSNFQTSSFEVAESAVIRLPLFDFPGMSVYVNNQKINHINNDCRGQEFCLGLITFDLDPGKYQMLVKLEDTPVRRWSLVFSIVMFLIVMALIVKGGKNERLD
jgi:hypothetical protein